METAGETILFDIDFKTREHIRQLMKVPELRARHDDSRIVRLAVETLYRKYFGTGSTDRKVAELAERIELGK